MNTCFGPADILLPREGETAALWPVVACDQFTSQRDYWEKAAALVGEKPSALHIVFPEVYLEDGFDRIESIQQHIESYLKEGVLTEMVHQGYVLVERLTQSGARIGLVGMVDLDAYDFTPGSGALIRATEATVQDRIPPRARVRRNAPIELPHVMLLIDNPEKTVIEPLTAATDSMEVVYDFDLMQNGGHIKGYKLSDAQIDAVADALTGLCSDEAQMAKYNLSGAAPLLFAVGDGNHSLATAKACYEEQKKGKTPEEYLALPARYALVEVVNNHDDALQFEPIHRVLFGVKPEHLMAELKKFYPDCYEGQGEGHVFAYNYEGKAGFITIPHPEKQLCVASVQTFLDKYLKEFGGEVDYIHGDEVVDELGSKAGNFGIKLPAMGKEQLFKTVMADGVLPRKTFSMGHAQDKRYYIEARKIVK